MAGLRFDLLQILQKCCHPKKKFMKLTAVFSSVSLRHNTGFGKEKPGSSAMVLTEGHLRKLQGKRRPSRDWWGGEEGSV